MHFWDQNYAAPGYKYGTAPNAFLAAEAWRLPARAKVLLPGDGEGRNGVWLARQGHQVWSIDGSEVGLAKARALASAAGVTITTEHVELAEWRPAPAQFDGLVLTYVHLPPERRSTVHQQLLQGLKPGGLLILEAFHPLQLGYSSGGPKVPELLYTLDQLEADFTAHCDTLLAWEGEVVLDEGPGHQGPGRVVRWLGQRRL